MAKNKVSFSFLNQKELPLIIEPRDGKQSDSHSLIQFIEQENDFIKEQLLKYGALLFRGFNVDSSDKFLEAINACSLGPIFNYDLCVVPRTKIKEGIYTSINCHPNCEVSMHNEKSYDSEFPSHIYFNCIKEPETGGITPLIDGHQLWLSLPEYLQQKLQSKGIMYRRYYYGDGIKHKFVKFIGQGLYSTTWMNAFNTNDKAKVEQILKTMDLQFRWTKTGNGLITEKLLPAVRYHPVTGKIVWFNQSDHNNFYCNERTYTLRSLKNPIARFLMSRKRFFHYVAYYGDGEPISKRDSDLMNLAMQKNIVLNPWKQGDLLLIDNYSCLHGKTPHTGERLILTGMTGELNPP